MHEHLKEKLAILPQKPGCYLMKNKQGTIIYVGKAKVLKNRVNQYFTGSHDYKVQKMVSEIADFEYIITKSEKEALLLEINLIKEHKPRYNVIFMDDKTYPYIKLTGEKYPRLLVVRDRKKDKKAQYFGPYTDVYSARQTVKLLNKLFPFRKCHVLPKKLCLYYDIKQCLGPCVFDIDPNIYQKMKQDVTRVLQGDVNSLVKKHEILMQKASEAMRYEKAQEHYEIVKALKHIGTKQSITFTEAANLDVFNVFSDKGYISIQLLHMRQGKLVERTSYLNPLYGTVEEAAESFIGQFYEHHPLPQEILLPETLQMDNVAEKISDRFFRPQRGKKHDLLKMAYDNAVTQLEEKFLIVNQRLDDKQEALETLNQLVGKQVSTIEIFDISHISGTNTVAGMVVFVDGEPNKAAYRRFKLQNKNSDVDSMKEVIYRRYLRLLKEKKSFPDLIIVDGGLPQIEAAKATLESLRIDIELVGLAKDDKHNTAVLLDRDGEILPVENGEPLFFLLANMQDEVHRYAIRYHQSLRMKAQTHSLLDEIEGVGPARKQQLLKHFKSFKAIKEADEAALAAVVPKDVAANIVKYFKKS